MSSYSPPTENVAIFDTINFSSGEQTLTQNQADKRYLRFPNAQGTETLQAINVNGLANFISDATFYPTANIIQQSGSQILQSPASLTSPAENALNSTYITQSISNGPCLTLQDTTTGSNLEYYGNTTASYQNPIVGAGESILAFTNSNNSASTIFRVSPTTNGLRLTSNTVSMGIGGTASTPTNNILVDSSSNTISTTGSNLSVQNTNVSFTSTTPPTSSQTIPAPSDSSNKIPTTAWVQSAISGIIPTTQFVPRFVNYSDTQGSGASYSTGPTINFFPNGGSGGGWGINDIVYFRITSQISFNPDGAGAYQNTGNTGGVLYFRPYYFSSAWAPISTAVPGSVLVQYAQNTPATQCAADRHACFYLPSFNIGNISYFYLSNGGVNGVAVSLRAPPQAYTFFVSIEYLGGRFSTPSCGITFSGGDTVYGGVNNYLPL